MKNDWPNVRKKVLKSELCHFCESFDVSVPYRFLLSACFPLFFRIFSFSHKLFHWVNLKVVSAICCQASEINKIPLRNQIKVSFVCSTLTCVTFLQHIIVKCIILQGLMQLPLSISAS